MITTNSNPNIWKEKAMYRRLQNKILTRRIKELTASRDKWKEKAKKLQQDHNIAKEELRSIEQVFKKKGWKKEKK